MTLLAIDPGPEQSAWLAFDARPLEFGVEPNESVMQRLADRGLQDHLVIEMVQSFGMPVGEATFETVFWIGRFWQAWRGEAVKVYRKDIKLHLCNSLRAKDSNIRQALIDRFGGREASIGLKRKPGPLYGVSKHEWSALAAAVYWTDVYGSPDRRSRQRLCRLAEQQQQQEYNGRGRSARDCADDDRNKPALQTLFVLAERK